MSQKFNVSRWMAEEFTECDICEVQDKEHEKACKGCPFYKEKPEKMVFT